MRLLSWFLFVGMVCSCWVAIGQWSFFYVPLTGLVWYFGTLERHKSRGGCVLALLITFVGAMPLVRFIVVDPLSVTMAKSAERRIRTTSFAVDKYVETRGELPFSNQSLDGELGVHSWRARVSHCLGEAGNYRLDQSWNSKKNSRLVESFIPEMFRDSKAPFDESSTCTPFVAVTVESEEGIDQENESNGKNSTTELSSSDWEGYVIVEIQGGVDWSNPGDNTGFNRRSLSEVAELLEIHHLDYWLWGKSEVYVGVPQGCVRFDAASQCLLMKSVDEFESGGYHGRGSPHIRWNRVIGLIGYLAMHCLPTLYPETYLGSRGNQVEDDSHAN
ncbi:MAG: hypothetical protein R3E01_06720 [Pirellulaceae bacterium]|nr:hypothetical protein [Planctomycetales bacterium]